jgi:hypothetical protein
VHSDRRLLGSQNFSFSGDVEGSSEGCFPRAVLAAFTTVVSGTGSRN